MYTLHCTLYAVYNVYIVQYTVYSVYVVHFALYSVHCTLYSVRDACSIPRLYIPMSTTMPIWRKYIISEWWCACMYVCVSVSYIISILHLRHTIRYGKHIALPISLFLLHIVHRTLYKTRTTYNVQDPVSSKDIGHLYNKYYTI